MSRLGSVLRVRVIEERRARGELARADAAVRAADGEINDRRRAYARRPRPAGLVSASGLRAVELLGLRCLERVAEAVAERDAALWRRDEAAAGLSQASVRRKSTERLVERREAEAAHQAQLAAQRDADELVLLMRRQGEGAAGAAGGRGSLGEGGAGVPT
jgi:hypothetical protein